MASPKIDHYSFGKVVVDGVEYHKDLIILPDRVLPNWWRVEGHVLAYEDLQQAIAEPPQVLVVGTGRYDRVGVPEHVRERLKAAGVELVVHPTQEACDAYNQLREQKWVVAALHLTC